MENKQSFGAFICQRRKELGMTQKEFAQKLFVTDSAVSKWERGLAYPDITLLQSICQVLDISEKELLSSSEDTEGRRSEQLARKYLRLARNYRLIQYILYGLTVLTCFVCNLAVQHTLSWFWIVLASELTAASLTLLPALTPEGKRGLWSLGGFTGSLLLLLLICCLYTGGTWFPTAALGTLLGLSVVFLPFVLRRLPLPEAVQSQKFSLYLGGVTALLLLLLAVVCLIQGQNWFFVAAASIIFGVGLVFGPIVLQKLPLRPPFAGRKPLLYLGAETILLILLYAVCCLHGGGTWFGTATLWTLFGLSAVCLPFLRRELPLPSPCRNHKALLYFSFESLFLLGCLAFQGWERWFPMPGLLLALAGLALPWGWLGALRYLPLGRWFRAAVGFLWTGLWTWLFPWALDRIFLLNGWESNEPYALRLPFDFTDWTDPVALNANVMVLVILFFVLLGFGCVFCGILQMKQRNRPKFSEKL